MIDNRGREVPLWRGRGNKADIPPALRLVVSHAHAGSKRFAISYAAGAFSGAAVLAAIALIVDARIFGEWRILVILSVMIVGLGAVLTYGGSIGRAGREEVAREGMLLIGRCPSCTYSLAGCAVEADECTVCPECGAAWRIANKSEQRG